MKPKSEDEDSRIKRASIGTLLYVAFHYLFYRILRIFWKPSDNDRAEQPAAAKVIFQALTHTRAYTYFLRCTFLTYFHRLWL